MSVTNNQYYTKVFVHNRKENDIENTLFLIIIRPKLQSFITEL